MTAPRVVLWALLATQFGAPLGCATAPPVADPARPVEILGLALPPTDTNAPVSEAARPASAETPDVRTPPRRPVGAVPGEPACGARIGARAVRRSALDRTLDAGLGNWLRGVDVEPKIEHGHFQGWMVRGIYAGDPCWSDVDLHVGDVVNRINRRPIERPEQAQAVWTALRSSGEIIVDFLRGGRPRTLRFAVVDDGN